MTTRPTIALLIPAYNAARFLPRLLRSAAAQNTPFDEIILHDDGSADETADVALGFGAKVVKSAINIGCTAGKARLLSETTAEWVHFHDADDELLKDFTSNALDVITSPDPFDVLIVGTEERADYDPSHLVVEIPDAALLAHSPLVFSIQYKVNAISGVYRREFLLKSRALEVQNEERYNEDQAIQLNLVLAQARFRCVPRVLTRSYKQSASMSQSNQRACLSSHYRVMMRALASLSQEEAAWDAKAAIAKRLWAIAAGAQAMGEFKLAVEAARQAKKISTIPEAAGGRLFRTIAMVHPGFALRLRERGIRIFKPHLRQA
ncbi:MAG: glycosyltransferase family 2 protein [Hyphomicrobium sp.]|nr:glycosyltransferase family 2 protein [Hyphomicrobium sp.]